MHAFMDEHGTLIVSSESVYESLALQGWLAKYQVQNINGVNMIPSRALVINSGGLSPSAASRPSPEDK